MKNIIRTISALLLFGICLAVLAGSGSAEEKKKGPCDGRQWKNSDEYLDCHYPNPPVGRWKAVYTQDFAKAHNLPAENISTDLSPGVDYMEMDVQPYAADGTACLVNMLIKRPNDVAMYNNRKSPYVWGPALHERRKLVHLLNLDGYKTELKEMTTFGLSRREMKYDPKKSYGIGGSFSFYAENVLADYDYVTADANCRTILMNKEIFPTGWAFWYAKASVWGRYQARYRNFDLPERPRGEAYFNSHLYINIPRELLLSIFEGMPIGGQ